MVTSGVHCPYSIQKINNYFKNQMGFERLKVVGKNTTDLFMWLLIFVSIDNQMGKLEFFFSSEGMDSSQNESYRFIENGFFFGDGKNNCFDLNK